MKKFKNILLAAVMIAILSSIAVFPAYASGNEEAGALSNAVISSLPPDPGLAYYYNEPTIKKGSTGSYVETAQRELKWAGCYTGAIDGIFGTATEAAVKKFQTKVGITVDGIIGPRTWSWLNYVYSEGIIL